ncbi:MAG TPA: BlaI/MecI/CopY family transcriptional regulator [Terriglobia bacterium]|jgi:predicted transcriptional regulator
MKLPKLTRLELKLMDTFWKRGACSVREIQEAFPERTRPAYTTVQTTVYRLEEKKALRLVKRIGKAKVFEAAITRDQAQTRLVDELLSLFGGQVKPVMARLVESGKFTADDIRDVEEMLREHREREPANASLTGRRKDKSK